MIICDTLWMNRFPCLKYVNTNCKEYLEKRFEPAFGVTVIKPPEFMQWLPTGPCHWI